MILTPLISIIVPVYNVEKYLYRCIDSILKQTYENFELILIDDGSPDMCPSICDFCAQTDSRIKCIHKLNGGVSSARNVGIDIAKGDYVVFVDSDDWIEDNYLEKLIPYLPGKDMLFYGASVLNSEGDLLNNLKLENLDSNGSSYAKVLDCLLKTEVFGHTCMMMIRKELIVNSSIRFRTNINIHEDFIFACECLLHSKSIATRTDTPYNYIQYSTGRHTLSSKLPTNYKSIALLRISTFIKLVSHVGILEHQMPMIRRIRESSYLGCIDVITRGSNSIPWKIQELRNVRDLFEITEPIDILSKQGFKQRVFQFLVNTRMPLIILISKWLVSLINKK